MNSILKISLLSLAICSFQSINCSDAKTKGQLRTEQSENTKNKPLRKLSESEKTEIRNRIESENIGIGIVSAVATMFVTVVLLASIGKRLDLKPSKETIDHIFVCCCLLPATTAFYLVPHALRSLLKESDDLDDNEASEESTPA